VIAIAIARATRLSARYLPHPVRYVLHGIGRTDRRGLEKSVAAFAVLAALDADQHALAVDIADLERGNRAHL
jgi:hypothetical protein